MKILKLFLFLFLFHGGAVFGQSYDTPQVITKQMSIEPGSPVVAGTEVAIRPHSIDGHSTRRSWKILYWPIKIVGPTGGPGPIQTNVPKSDGCPLRSSCTFTVPLDACEPGRCRPVLGVIVTAGPERPYGLAHRHVACIHVIHPDDPSIVSSGNCGQRIDESPQPDEPDEPDVVVDSVVLDFPHFVNGMGTISELVLVNTADYVVPFAIRFFGEDGYPIASELLVDLTEDLEVTEDGDLVSQLGMDPLGELTISTHGRDEMVSGSVQVTAEGPIGGVLRLHLSGIGVA